MRSPDTFRPIIVTMFFCMLVQSASGQISEPADTSLVIPTPIVLMPILNLSGYREQIRSVDSLLQLVLREQEVDLLTGSDLRTVLKRNRIRSNGRVNAIVAETIWLETGYQYLMLCSVDFCTPEPVAEIALSGRLLDLNNVTIISASSAASSSIEHTRPFLQDSPIDEDILIEIVVRALIRDLAVATLPATDRGTESPGVIIVPFENGTGLVRASDIAGNILLTTLFRSGYNVVEPGLVHELFLSNGFLPVGEIDLVTLGQLHELYRPDYLITGSVEDFLSAQEGRTGEGALFEFTSRVLESNSGKLLAGRYHCLKGNDEELILGIGREESTGNMMMEAISTIPALIDSIQLKGVATSE
jgi:hypothetical protein